MKIPKEPVSAFAIYSEKLRQKKKPKKALVSNVVSTVKKKSAKINDLNILQVKEINNIMQALAKHTSSPNTTIKSMENTSSQVGKLKRKVDKKSHNENIQTNTSNKKKKRVQADKVQQLLNKEIEVCLVNYGLKKKKLKPIEGIMGKQKTEILRTDPSNKIIKTKHVIQNKKIVIEEDKNKVFENEEKKTIKGKNKSDKIKLKKKKERLTKSDGTNQENSAFSAKHLFEWLILPITEKDFMG